jgi:hypothetical protein
MAAALHLHLMGVLVAQLATPVNKKDAQLATFLERKL